MDTYIIANRTDVGKERMVNEDSMVTFDSPNGRVIAVCDGMGGQAAGDVASRLACDIITDILENNTFSSPEEAITRAITAANQGILHRAQQNPELDGMGATCVMVIIRDGRVHYGWVGDSRIYYITKSGITQLSRDQSYVQQLVNSGQITKEEAEHHPQKNEILNALGLSTMTPPELSPTPITPDPGSVILLCSDGLSGTVADSDMEAIVRNPGLSLQQKADMLIDRANANGGIDNITVQLVEFGKQGGASKEKAKGFAGLDMKTIYIALAAIVIVILGIILGMTISRKDDVDKVKTETIDNRREEHKTVKPAPEHRQAAAPKKKQAQQPKAQQSSKTTKQSSNSKTKKKQNAIQNNNKETNKPKNKIIKDKRLGDIGRENGQEEEE